MNEQGRICFEVFAEYLLVLKKHAQKLQAAYFEQLIDGLLYEFYDPEHPIRNTLEPLDSVEEVRIIQQAVPR
jgi:transcription termination factor NusB